MNEPSRHCDVCDGPAHPGAPLPLCKPCIATIHRYAVDSIELATVERVDEPCPWCDRLTVVARGGLVGGTMRCQRQMGGCGKAVPSDPDVRDEIARLRVEAPTPLPAPVQVYYLRAGERIKIGASVHPRMRASSLALSPGNIMATEPGGFAKERQRHQQFAHLRAEGEWFWSAPDLLAHIASLQP